MEIKRILTYFLVGIILSSCAQSTAMIGPAITLASSGNMSQAGLTFFGNKAVEKETGMDALSLVSNKIETNSSKNRKFRKLVETNFEKTRKKLILQDQSNIFN